MTDIVLETENLNKEFAGFVAVNGVNLQVARGTIHALTGGKTTCFNLLVGAFIIIAMQNYLAQVGQWVTVIQGTIFLVCVLLFRRGVVGEIAHYLRIRL